MANNTSNKPYLTSSVIKTDKDVPYALQIEGYVSKQPFFREATDDKKAYLSVSIGVRGPAERLMALADGSYDKTKDYGDGDSFADLILFGATAEKMSKVLDVGRRVVVSGPMSWGKEYTRKDGTTAKDLVITVDNIIDGGSHKKGVDPTVGSFIAATTMSYTSKDGVNRNIPMAATVSGSVIGASGLKTKGDTTYLNFGIRTNMPAEKIVDLANGTYNKDKAYDEKKTIINATVFGRAAENLSKVIRDGAIVVVSGPAEAQEYDGKVSYKIRPRDSAVTVLKYAATAEGDAPAAAAAGTAAADTGSDGDFFPMDGVDDGELPF